MTYAILNVSWKLIDLLYVILNLFSLKSSLHKIVCMHISVVGLWYWLPTFKKLIIINVIKLIWQVVRNSAPFVQCSSWFVSFSIEMTIVYRYIWSSKWIIHTTMNHPSETGILSISDQPCTWFCVFNYHDYEHEFWIIMI